MENSVSFDIITKRVLITGFAPFGGIATNPSWDGIEAMNTEDVEMKHNIVLTKEKIEVRYNHVDESVPKLWKELQPNLTIHVGVSNQTECFQLETQACKNGYELGDLDGVCPADYQCTSDGPDQITTGLDVDVLCKEFNMEPPAEGLHANLSHCAGKYLCEYLYYTSLCRDPSKTLFVHVPLTQYSPEQIAVGLERILEICLKQLQSRDVYY